MASMNFADDLINTVKQFFKILKETIWNGLKIPLEFWFSLPGWVHYIIISILVTLSTLILVFIYKKRHDLIKLN